MNKIGLKSMVHLEWSFFFSSNSFPQKEGVLPPASGQEMMKKHKSCHSRREEEEECQKEYLCNWAELVLPWLSPTDLASISSTCKSLHLISKSVTTQRSLDASRSLENSDSIPFHNTLDAHPYSYFIYTPSSIIGFPSSIPLHQSWGGQKPQSPIWGTPPPPILHPKPIDFPPLIVENASGCVCNDCCEEIDGEFQCQCASLRPGVLGLSEDVGVMTECGENCGCGVECGNRTTQRGVPVRLKIVRDSAKGWGLHADQFIRSGEFICEYAGNCLKNFWFLFPSSCVWNLWLFHSRCVFSFLLGLDG